MAALPERLVPYIQICDALFSGAQADPLVARAEATAARLLPGDGVLPLRPLIRALPANSAISVESPLADVDARADPSALARRAMTAALSVLAVDAPT